jgi:hypothetical protein
LQQIAKSPFARAKSAQKVRTDKCDRANPSPCLLVQQPSQPPKGLQCCESPKLVALIHSPTLTSRTATAWPSRHTQAESPSPVRTCHLSTQPPTRLSACEQCSLTLAPSATAVHFFCCRCCFPRASHYPLSRTVHPRQLTAFQQPVVNKLALLFIATDQVHARCTCMVGPCAWRSSTLAFSSLSPRHTRAFSIFLSLLCSVQHGATREPGWRGLL